MMWTKKQLERAYINQTRQNYELQKENDKYQEALENIEDIQEIHRVPSDLEVLEIVRKALAGDSE